MVHLQYKCPKPVLPLCQQNTYSASMHFGKSAISSWKMQSEPSHTRQPLSEDPQEKVSPEQAVEWGRKGWNGDEMGQVGRFSQERGKIGSDTCQIRSPSQASNMNVHLTQVLTDAGPSCSIVTAVTPAQGHKCPLPPRRSPAAKPPSPMGFSRGRASVAALLHGNLDRIGL